MTNTAELPPLRDKLRALRDSGTLTRSSAEALVHSWVREHMPGLPRPTVSTRAFECGGKLYVRATITVQPMCMDVVVSQESEGA